MTEFFFETKTEPSEFVKATLQRYLQWKSSCQETTDDFDPWAEEIIRKKTSDYFRFKREFLDVIG